MFILLFYKYSFYSLYLIKYDNIKKKFFDKKQVVQKNSYNDKFFIVSVYSSLLRNNTYNHTKNIYAFKKFNKK